MAKKRVEKTPESREIIHDAFVQFCAEHRIDGAEMAASLLTPGVFDDIEEMLGHVMTFCEEKGEDPDPLLIAIAEKIDALPSRSVTETHMSVLEGILLTREGVLREGMESPEHVAFAVARLAKDRMRGHLLSLVGSAPNYQLAIQRAIALAYTCIGSFAASPADFLQNALRDLPADQSFLRKIYEAMFEELRRDQEWRKVAAENLASVLSDSKIAAIRETVFSVDNWDGVRSQRSCLYQTLVNFWLPDIEDPVGFLAGLSIHNPDESERSL